MTATDKSAALDTITRVRADRQRLADEELAAVSTARNHNTTWKAVADAIGTTQPYATRKFGKRLTDAAGDPDQALTTLRVIPARREQLDTEELHAVADARTHGATWDEIAERMGRASSNVQVSFAPKLKTRTTVADETPAAAEE